MFGVVALVYDVGLVGYWFVGLARAWWFCVFGCCCVCAWLVVFGLISDFWFYVCWFALCDSGLV